MHPASSWTALGQVVAALLSLLSLFLPRLAVPCVLIFLHFAFVFLRSSFERMPLRRSRHAHTQAATIASLTAPMAVPSSGTVPVSASTVRVSASTVPSSSGSVASASAVRGGRRGWPPVVQSAPWDEPTPPSSGDFVPSRDGVLALIRDELRTLQNQFMPKTPYNLCNTLRVDLSLVSCSLLGCLMVACCISCIVVARVLANWAICQLCRHGCFTPIFWLRSACTLVTVFVCWFAHVFHVCVLVCPCFSLFIVLTLMG